MGSSVKAFDNWWTVSEALSKGCSSVYSKGKDDRKGLASFVNTTTPVIRDMVEIIERLGELREKDANLLLAKTEAEPAVMIREQTKWKKGQEKIKYWVYHTALL